MNLKIIDAHLHFAKFDYFDEIAIQAGHENNAENLRNCYSELGIVRGIVMGNSVKLEDCNFPEFLSYCVGLDSVPEKFSEKLPLIEEHLKRRECVGIKLYPGYQHFYIYDDSLSPLYKLAKKYEKPVAVHMGMTATNTALLKYSHPFTMDEAAVKFREVQFVMCHFGCPHFEEAAAVVRKNPNVATDLSGMMEGKQPGEIPVKRTAALIHQLRDWLDYTDRFEKIMFGTDWPLANLGDYINFVKAIVPESEYSKVFRDNAARIYFKE